MAGFSFDFSAFKQLSADLAKISKQVQANERAAVMAAGHAYERDVKAIAPVDTGQYRASIRTETSYEGLAPVALIGTPMPQACRLEYGFWDKTDRLGRHFFQYPRPHWRPAWDANLDKYVQIMMAKLTGDELPSFPSYSMEKRSEVSLSSSIASRLRPDITGRI